MVRKYSVLSLAARQFQGYTAGKKQLRAKEKSLGLTKLPMLTR